jgi:hypothetical protein
MTAVKNSERRQRHHEHVAAGHHRSHERDALRRVGHGHVGQRDEQQREQRAGGAAVEPRRRADDDRDREGPPVEQQRAPPVAHPAVVREHQQHRRADHDAGRQGQDERRVAAGRVREQRVHEGRDRRQLAQDDAAAHVPHPVGHPLVVLGERAEEPAQHRRAAGRRCLVHVYRIVVPACDLDRSLTRRG